MMAERCGVANVEHTGGGGICGGLDIGWQSEGWILLGWVDGDRFVSE